MVIVVLVGAGHHTSMQVIGGKLEIFVNPIHVQILQSHKIMENYCIFSLVKASIT